jgi:hypothetical protein
MLTLDQEEGAKEIFFDTATNLSPFPSDLDSSSITIARNPFQTTYLTGLFSDISLIYKDRTFNLHKIILIQSIHFKNQINNEKSVLDLRSNNILTLEGLELVLKDLYQFKRQVSVVNAMQVLCCSLFLEVEPLATYCLEFITEKLAKFDSVLVLAKQMDMLDAVKELRNDQGFRKLLRKYRKKLESAILGSILYCVTFLIDNTSVGIQEVVELSSKKDASLGLKTVDDGERVGEKDLVEGSDINDSSANDIFVLANEGAEMTIENQKSNSSEKFEVGSAKNTKKSSKNICPLVKSISTIEQQSDESKNSTPKIFTVKINSNNANIGGVIGSAGIERTLPVHVFLAKLPLSWIEKVVCADQLYVRSEFDRYQLVKKILDLRHSGSEFITNNLSTNDVHGSNNLLIDVIENLDTSEGEDIEIESNDENQVEIESGNVSDKRKLKEVNEAKPFNSIFNMIDKFLPLRKKRKLDSDEEVPIQIYDIKRKIKKITKNPQNLPKALLPITQPILPKTLTNIYNTGIIYTWMTFPQLGIVKKDEMVPFNLALESYWLQAELGLSTQQTTLPKFRFGAKFSNLSRDLELQKTITSDSFECAGVFFRVVLNMDTDGVKCLLQKSVGKINDVSYKIWCFDQRFGVDCGDLGVMPCTECKLDQEGFANVVPSLMVKNEECESDDVFVVVCVSFGK